MSNLPLVAFLIIAGLIAGLCIVLVPIKQTFDDSFEHRNEARRTVIQSFGMLGVIASFFYTAESFRLEREVKLETRIKGAIVELYSTKPQDQLSALVGLKLLCVNNSDQVDGVIDSIANYLKLKFPVNLDARDPIVPTGPTRAVALSTLGLAEIPDTTRSKTKLGQLNFNGSKINGLDLSQYSFENSQFVGAELTSVEFVGAKLRGVDFNDAVLSQVNFTEADVTDADFSGATVINCPTLLNAEGYSTILGTPEFKQ